jgi:cytochrome b561
MRSNNSVRYGAVAQAFHWLTVVLIAVCMRGNDDASKMIGVITDRDICMHTV